MKLSDAELSLMELWQRENEMYVISSAHDDWLWMLATVADEDAALSGGHGGLVRVVSNDLMRNHRTSLLDARRFMRWRYTQVLHYDLSKPVMPGEDAEEPPEVRIFRPPPFSRELQRTGATWHVPVFEEDGDAHFFGHPNPKVAASRHLWAKRGAYERHEENLRIADDMDDAVMASAVVEGSYDSIFCTPEEVADIVRNKWLCVHAADDA